MELLFLKIIQLQNLRKKVLEKKGIIKKITGDLYTINPDCVAYGNITKQESAKKVLENIKNAKVLKGENNA